MFMLQPQSINIDLENENLVSLPARTANIVKEDRTLQLVYALHSSLDIKEIIQQFARCVKNVVATDGINYRNERLRLLINAGSEGKHSFSYALNNETKKENCGEITFTRNTRFTDTEIMQLEDLLCLLIHPLRNAIEYQLAIKSALYDPLTGVANRSALNTSLRREIELAKRYNMSFSILLVDLDKFKNINDTYGHSAGDKVLKSVAKQLGANIRDSDMVFRMGGEEFLILLSKTDTEGSVKLADRIRKSIEETTSTHKGNDIQATVSIGIASYIAGDTDLSLIDKADTALYRAKKQGRNRVCS